MLDFLLHFDKHLNEIIAHYGTATYAILFAILFCETGLVIMPLLPGDSLLFAVGAVTATGVLSLPVVFGLLFAAVFLGDNVNYWIGYHIGPRVFSRDDVKFLNKKHLVRTQEFFEKYGNKTVIMARFVPIVRTCTPFVAGIGRMPYPRFLAYSVTGCLLWLSICLFAGYWFGGLDAVKRNFSLVVIAIVAISLLPLLIEFLRHRKGGGKDQ